MGTANRQNISEGIEDWTINQPDVTDIYRTLNPTLAEYTIFSSIHKIFYQNNPYSGPQNKYQYIKKNSSHINYILWP